MEHYEDLEKVFLTLRKDLTKFYTKGNKTAAIRARKALQDIKALSQIIRMDISEKRRTNDSGDN